MPLLDKFSQDSTYNPKSFSLMDRFTNPMTQYGLALLTGGDPARAASLARKSQAEQRMMPYQMKMMQAQMQSLDAAAKQRIARSEYIGGLPENERGAAEAFPEQFAKRQFADTKTNLQKEYDRAKVSGFVGSIGEFAQSKQRPRITSGPDEIPSPTDLLKFRDKDDNPPKNMLSFKQLQEQGYQLSDKPTEKGKIASYISNSLTTASDAVQSILDKPDFDPTAPEHVAGELSDFLASGDYQIYKAASDEWATNMVFLRSGATAREEEKAAAFKNFWPQPGNKPEAVFFKNKFRINQEINAHALAGMEGRVSKEVARTAIKRLEKKLEDLESKGIQDIEAKSIGETVKALRENVYQFGSEEKDKRMKEREEKYGKF